MPSKINMIIPLGASEVYRISLKEAWDRYSVSEMDALAQKSFCDGFQAGWQGAKNHTFQLLERICNLEGNDDGQK